MMPNHEELASTTCDRTRESSGGKKPAVGIDCNEFSQIILKRQGRRSAVVNE